jgi:uncharacterized short protein YbdD (DUF466 family)
MNPAAIAKRLWQWLRATTGDAAYENYLRRATNAQSQANVLSQREFYLETLKRRYNTVNRCC